MKLQYSRDQMPRLQFFSICHR